MSARMLQTWHNLLFAHWPLSPADVRPLVPDRLEIDTFQGQAWLGILPLRISRVRLRFVPPIPGRRLGLVGPMLALPGLAQINVRTYVTMDGAPGVFFFGLEANNLPAVWGARVLFHLPYHLARIKVHSEGDRVYYASHRGRSQNLRAVFRAVYHPTSAPAEPRPGSLEDWLVNRWRLYTVAAGRLYHAETRHAPWPLQTAEAEIEENTLAAVHGLRLPHVAPVLHYSRLMQSHLWPPRPV